MSKKGRIKWSGSLFFSFMLSVSLVTGLYSETVWAKEETSAVIQASRARSHFWIEGTPVKVGKIEVLF